MSPSPPLTPSREVVPVGEPGSALARLRPRTLVDDVRTEVASAIDGAPRWVAGALAGVQGAVLSLLVVIVPVLVAYVATAADPANGQVGWTGAAAVGASVWLLGHGVPLGTATGVVTIVPLGLTALAVFACYASARRSGSPALSGWLSGTGGYVAVGLLVALTQLSGATEAGVGALRLFASAGAGALLVSAAGLGLGLLARDDAPTLTETLRPMAARLPRTVRLGAGGGLAAAAAVVALGAVVVLTWIFAGQAAVVDIVAALGLDPLSGIALAVGQLVFVPNLVLWAVAWLAGPGFAVGAGSHFATTEVIGAPLPAVPLLGVLPQPDSVTPAAAWWPLAVVAVGVLVGVVLRRRLGPAHWTSSLAVAAVGAAVAGLCVAGLVWASGGAAGPGRMEQVGASALVSGVAVGALAGLGLALVLVLAGAEVRRAVAGGFSRLTRRVSRDG